MLSFSRFILESMWKSMSCKVKGDQRNASNAFQESVNHIHPHTQLQSNSSLGDKFSSKRRINSLHIFVKLNRDKCTKKPIY